MISILLSVPNDSLCRNCIGNCKHSYDNQDVIGTVFAVMQRHTPGDFLRGWRMCKHPLCTRPAQDHTYFNRLQCYSANIAFALSVLTTARLHLADLLHPVQISQHNTRFVATEDSRAVFHERVDGDVPLKCCGK